MSKAGTGSGVSLAESAEVGAAAAVVYDLLADFEDGHPRILPPRYFTGLEVERGGRGAGTVFSCEMRLMGARRRFRAEVTEPEPGRVLAERILDDRDMITTFTVDDAGPDRCRVTIASSWPAPALRALFERRVAVPALRRVYREELACIQRHVAGAGIRA